jgi:transcriptional regulator of aromatic amino acid metabolism
MRPPGSHGTPPLAEVTSSNSLLIPGARAGSVYLIVRTPTHDEVRLVRDGESLIFGRTSRAAVRLNSELVSRSHAQLRRAGGLLEIEDLRSRNGTFVNDRRIEVPTRLRAGSVVRIGGMEVVIGVGEEDATSVGLLVADAAMVQPFALARKAARSSAPVLVSGEPGSGKSIFAAQIHRWSERRARRFLAIDGAEQPDLLMELEAARGGTLFIDDVDALTPHLQARLAHALIVGTGTRIIAATRFDLRTAVVAGRFDAALAARLSAHELSAPPLRQLPAELTLLALRFIEAAAHERGIAVPYLSREASDEMLMYSWPGNLGELGESMVHAVRACSGGRIRVEDLPSTVRMTAQYALATTG